MSLPRLVMKKFYRKAAGDPHRLPWHHEDPGRMLVEAVEARKGRGRALDVGCGSGIFTAWLAEHGMEATGIDRAHRHGPLHL